MVHRSTEKVKKIFDEAYKAETNRADVAHDIKYALTEYGFEELTKATRNNLKMQNVEVIDSRDVLEKKIENALNGEERQLQFTLGAISDLAKARIEADTQKKLFKDRQYSFIVNGDDFIHISNHFDTVREIADEVVRLYDIVTNYDSVDFKLEGNQKKLIFEKSYPHADIRSVEVASNNRNSLNLVTVFYTKKNRSQSVPPATSNSNSSSQWGSTPTSFSISQSENNTSDIVEYSLNEDSDGNRLSEQQSEYFVDSKIRDENGNLKKMYHGSPETFTVFDRKKAKSSGYYGRGFYFSDSASHAGQYGNLNDPPKMVHRSTDIFIICRINIINLTCIFLIL